MNSPTAYYFANHNQVLEYMILAISSHINLPAVYPLLPLIVFAP